MFSMDFEEFLWAKGYGNETVENLLSHMKAFIPFSELEMDVFHSLFLDYNILGGMPAVAREYIERNTFEGTLDIQKQLIADYKEDIRKYASGVDQTRIINVFNRVAPQLARENKKFQISKVVSEHYPDIRYGIKLSKNNIGHEDKIYTFPYFCSFLLKRFMSGFHAEEEAE